MVYYTSSLIVVQLHHTFVCNFLFLVDYRAAFASTFLPLSYLTTKNMFLMVKTRNTLITTVTQRIKCERETNQSHAPSGVKTTNFAAEAPIQLQLQADTKQKQIELVQPKKDEKIVKSTPMKSTISKLYDPNQNTKRRCASNTLLLFVSLLYLSFGIGFIYLVFDHFDKNSKICSNPSAQVLTKHPELYVWDQCIYKTMPFSNGKNDIICNCRQAKIDVSSFCGSNSEINSTNTGKIIESMLIEWDMLEIVYITDESLCSEINLNKTSHYNAKYLKILHLENVKFNTITDGIENWDNLEYLSVTHAHWNEWPTNFEKLNKISYLNLLDILYLGVLPPNICEMPNLRAIKWQQNGGSISKVSKIPDCIVNLVNLQSVVFSFTILNQFPIELFSMSSIEEIVFFVSNVSIHSFTSSSSYDDSLLDFDWNSPSKTTYSLQGAASVCDIFDEYGYDGNMPLKLWQFLNETDACDNVCPLLGRDSSFLQQFTCSPLLWGNGVCDEECNIAGCNWDGGDCNQLCLVEYSDECNIFSAFDNGFCDQLCNNSVCEYDKYECISDKLSWNDYNLTALYGLDAIYCNNDNDSDIDIKFINDSININSNYLCQINWIDDLWCDENCRKSDECFGDFDDCQCNNSNINGEINCFRLYDTFSLITDTETEIHNGIIEKTVSLNGFCQTWEYAFEVFQNWATDVTYFGDEIEKWRQEDKSCQWLFNQTDLNNNDYIDIHEIIYLARNALSLSESKAKQINCTSCM